MAKDFKPLEDLNAKAKQAVEQTMEQTRGAVDSYFDYLKKTVSSTPSGGSEFSEKLKTHAEKNITAAHEFIKQLSQAKDFQDLVRIQTEFMQDQLKEFAEQTKSLGEAYTKAAADAVNKPLKKMS
jgi:hypothetical protein